MMTRNEFRRMVLETAASPSDNNLTSLADDLGYLEILVILARNHPILQQFDDSEPLFHEGKINWPPPKGD